jgi:hypothetical protein
MERVSRGYKRSSLIRTIKKTSLIRSVHVISVPLEECLLRTLITDLRYTQIKIALAGGVVIARLNVQRGE